MSLTPLQLLQLRVADDLGTPGDRVRLVEAGVDPTEWRELRSMVSELLDGGPEPDLADGVFERLGLSDGDPALRAALSTADDVELSDQVLDALALTDETPQVRSLLHQTHVDPAPVELADAVMAQLDVQGDDALAGALLDGAGEAPQLWGAISQAIGADAVAPVVPLRPRRWQLPAIGVAAAAALLLFFQGVPSSQGDEFAFDVSGINHVDIEDISTDQDAMVQVLQFDDDAPPIIFIDVIDPASLPGAVDDEGATL